ncbi:patatin-like phospholipase family protein [Chelatococcus reniformis]|uniref:Alpha/beta hydrolase n=1 Tax=Chelatococcus reniformis TaxID=1494448 RepID=A0A916UXD8_9HYPH|nr:patatin-like phospholipase family protein [Chelatococcus reniformis]GGC93013.1 alpha/beta hydrolase [Chelatococcus reniformis]
MLDAFFRRKPPPVGLAGPGTEKYVALALQGGGAHGAFTWGVLDALLEDGRLGFEAISGASAGAMNAVVMADGFLADGVDGARAHLERFWKAVSLDGTLNPVQRAVMDQVLGFWSGAVAPFSTVLRQMSPYESNPLNINALRSVVEELIDFPRVRQATAVKLYVSATNVRTGKLTIFAGGELTADHLMASACLPTIFQTVEIDDVPYWDGGYSGNPPLIPLFYEASSDDILLVQINPIERAETPRSHKEIENRLSEINFNSALLRELRTVEFVGRLIDEGKLSLREYKRVLMHRIDADEVLNALPGETRGAADWRLFQDLRDAGRACAQAWLGRHYGDIGSKATLDLAAMVA